jgi:tetraacyldisaccharide 4'-kinase
MEGDFIEINKKLLPLSWLYGLGVGFRNFCFESGILKSKAYQTPVISVGNITVGGTGKTPHVEYLVHFLKDQMKVAVLSRGYKRKSRGFLIGTPETTIRQLGDEPYLMKLKYPDITVAVDNKRTRGIENLTETSQAKKPDVILLDDAFQHRYVKPGINILLVDYHRLIIYDTLLPAGRLREPLKEKNRADIVIITKCPKDLKPMEYRVLTKQMGLFPYQQLFFTTLSYEQLQPIFPEAGVAPSMDDISNRHVLLLTGIASPRQMLEDLKPHVAKISPLVFGDHHAFKQKDIRKINEAFASLQGPKIIITTEKDAVRLTDVEGLSDEVRKNLFALPIRINFMQEGENTFKNSIIGYVRKNSRNSILAKGKDNHKPKDGDYPGDRPRTISFRNN